MSNVYIKIFKWIFLLAHKFLGEAKANEDVPLSQGVTGHGELWSSYFSRFNCKPAACWEGNAQAQGAGPSELTQSSTWLPLEPPRE